jgi:hypothetical protein
MLHTGPSFGDMIGAIADAYNRPSTLDHRGRVSTP